MQETQASWSAAQSADGIPINGLCQVVLDT